MVEFLPSPHDIDLTWFVPPATSPSPPPQLMLTHDQQNNVETVDNSHNPYEQYIHNYAAQQVMFSVEQVFKIWMRKL